jgi:hypothetical protein
VNNGLIHMDIVPRKYSLTALAGLAVVLMGVMAVSLAQANRSAQIKSSYAKMEAMMTVTPTPSVSPTPTKTTR